MNIKTLTILGIITVALIGVAILMSQQKESVSPQTGQPVFPGLMSKINEVSELVVKAQSGTMTIVRDGESWNVKEKHNYPANMGKIRDVLIGLGELKILEAKTKKPELYEKLGLEDVEGEGSISTGVTLKDSAGTTLAEVIIGKQRPSKGNPNQDEVYVRKAGDPETWLTIGKLSIEKNLSEWLDKDFLEVESKRVRRVRITHPDNTTLVLEKENPDDLDFQITNLPEGKEIQSQFAVNNIVSTVTSLMLDDVQPNSEISFEDESVITVTFETFDGLEGTVKLFRKDEKDYVKVFAAFNADLIWKPESEETSEPEEPVEGEDAEDKEDNEIVETPKPEKPKVKPEAEVKAEIEALNKKVSEWVYVIPKFRADTILKKTEDLVKKS
jgi:hypothetical protein